MNWLKDFESELSHVFTEAENIVSKFPVPLNRRGLTYLDKFNVFKDDGTKNYICYLLPFWLKDLASMKSEHCRRLSLANVFVMLYFFVQDDLMDTNPPEWKEQLALGNLFYLEFLEIYRSHFPPGSPFWFYYKEYIAEWAASVANEQKEDYFQTRPKMAAQKASPVKLASTGALLLSNQARLIPSVSDCVDHVLITLQMVDDWVDWKEDLETGNDNGMLSFIRSELQLHPDHPLTEEEVTKSLYVDCSLGRYAAAAAANREQLCRIGVQIPHLYAFHETLLHSLVQDARNIEEEKNNLLRGGLHYWLSKNSNFL